jgi:hypothetical protein
MNLGDDALDLPEGQSRDYEIDAHLLRVTATAQVGWNTGRRRYRVECLTCGEVVHVATTGPHWNMRDHVREKGIAPA